MAMTVPGQQRSNTRFTFGQSDRFQRAIQNRLQNQITSEKIVADQEYRAEKLVADQKYRDDSLQLQKDRLNADSTYREKMTDFAQEEKIANQEQRSKVLAHQQRMQTEAVNANIRNDNFKKSRLGIESLNTYGANIIDVAADGTISVPPAVVKDQSGKYVKNPILPPQVQVDIKDKRYIPLSELSYKLKVTQALSQAMGMNDLENLANKKKEASSFVFDPFKFMPEEKAGFWGAGFNEEQALDNLMGKSQYWNEITNTVSVLEKDNPKRVAVLGALKQLLYGKGGSKGDIKGSGLMSMPKEGESGYDSRYYPMWGFNRQEYRLKQKTLSDLLKAKIEILEK